MRIVSKSVCAFASLSMFMAFTNCSRFDVVPSHTQASRSTGQGSLPEDPFNNGKVQIDANYLAKSEENFAAVNERILSESVFKLSKGPLSAVEGFAQFDVDMIVPKGTSLAVLINPSCAMNGFGGEISQTYSEKGTTPSIERTQYAAFEWTTARSISIGDLNLLAEADLCVRGISQNVVYKPGSLPINDPSFNVQKHLAAVGAKELFERVQKKEIQISPERVIVAVVDTGVDVQHEDLRNAIVQDIPGHNSLFGEWNQNVTDEHGHGTHVAGLIAATFNNGVGGSGIAGPYKIEILPVKALGAGGGTDISIYNGIVYAVQNGAHVINLSLGSGYRSPSMLSSLRYAIENGVIVVIAAGNDNVDIDKAERDWSIYIPTPAIYGHYLQGAVTVGSINATDLNKSSFSNYSNRFVEIAAPGEDAANVGVYSTTIQSRGKFERLRGTSMATPLVSGAAAVAIAELRNRGQIATPALVESILTQSAKMHDSLKSYVAFGRILDMTSLYNYIDRTYPVKPKAGSSGPQIVSHPTPQEALLGTSLVLRVQALGQNLRYSWKKDDRVLQQGSQSFLTLGHLTASDEGEYSVVVENDYGRIESNRATVRVLSSRPVVIGHFDSIQETAEYGYATGWLSNTNQKLSEDEFGVLYQVWYGDEQGPKEFSGVAGTPKLVREDVNQFLGVRGTFGFAAILPKSAMGRRIFLRVATLSAGTPEWEFFDQSIVFGAGTSTSTPPGSYTPPQRGVDVLPYGFFDGIDSGGQGSGWAHVKGSKCEWGSMWIEFYDAPIEANGRLVHSTRTVVKRPDVTAHLGLESSDPLSSFCGFVSNKFPESLAGKVVYAYAKSSENAGVLGRLAGEHRVPGSSRVDAPVASQCSTPVSETEYLNQNPDVRNAGMNAFLHYALHGKNEGRCPVIGACAQPLSGSEYLIVYDDVKRAGVDPVQHYNTFGRYEGRCPIR